MRLLALTLIVVVLLAGCVRGADPTARPTAPVASTPGPTETRGRPGPGRAPAVPEGVVVQRAPLGTGGTGVTGGTGGTGGAQQDGRPPLPCPAPAGGWPPEGPSDAASLVHFREQLPYWSGAYRFAWPVTGGFVVGGPARDEAEAVLVRAELEALFPGRVCVLVVPELALFWKAMFAIFDVPGHDSLAVSFRWVQGMNQTMHVGYPRLTPELTRLRDTYPDGMVELYPLPVLV